VTLDLLEQRRGNAQQERSIWGDEIQTVVIPTPNRKEGEIRNPHKRADICARFFQPIHQRHEVVGEGSQTTRRMDPAFQCLLAGLPKQEPDAAAVGLLRFRNKEADQEEADGWSIGARELPGRGRDRGLPASDPAR
jgi:hypothetical protein